MHDGAVKTRILILSDTHGAPLTSEGNGGQAPSPPFTDPLPAADVLIHCGDLTSTGTMEQYHKTLDMIRAIDAPVKLVIAGNHDLTLDRDFVQTHVKRYGSTSDQALATFRKAHDLWTSSDGRAVQENVTLLSEGSHRIRLPNGASLSLYASPYTPEFYDWGFPYARSEDRFNTPAGTLADATNIAPYPISSFSQLSHPLDVLVTHGPPWKRLDQTSRGEYAGCPHLLRALMRSRPRLHCFGHIHEGWGAERVRWSDADVVDRLSLEKFQIRDWADRRWKEGVQDVSAVKCNLEEAKARHAVFVDLSKDGGSPLESGRETLLVNASIMDVKYRPVNAPWIVDIDLPKSRNPTTGEMLILKP